MTSTSAWQQPSTHPLTVMVLSWLYSDRSWRLHTWAGRTSFALWLILKGCNSKCVEASRGDGDLGVCVLFYFLQVASLFPNQTSNKIVVGQNLQRNLISAANRNTHLTWPFLFDNRGIRTHHLTPATFGTILFVFIEKIALKYNLIHCKQTQLWYNI